MADREKRHLSTRRERRLQKASEYTRPEKRKMNQIGHGGSGPKKLALPQGAVERSRLGKKTKKRAAEVESVGVYWTTDTPFKDLRMQIKGSLDE